MRTLLQSILGFTALASLALSFPLLAQPAEAQTETVFHDFTGGNDGSSPFSYLTQDRAGNFYGIAQQGGALAGGVIFKLTSAGAYSVVHSFTAGNLVSTPNYGVTIDRTGNFYGIGYGGNPTNGTVYKVSRAGTETALHDFTGGSDGGYPYNSLVIVDRSGNVYGVTDEGGDTGCILNPGGCGTVWKITATGTFSVLHAFTGFSDGASPKGGPLLDKAGNLYGTAGFGGDEGRGVIWKITSDGTFSVVSDFAGSVSETPAGPLTRDNQGNFYGAGYNGGDFGYGSVWKVAANGAGTTLYSFTGGSDGSHSYHGVVRDRSGNLYGGTGLGVDKLIFKLAPDGTFTVLHNFAGAPSDGLSGYGVLLGRDGNLYGATGYGGSGTCGLYGCGTLYSLTTQ